MNLLTKMATGSPLHDDAAVAATTLGLAIIAILSCAWALSEQFRHGNTRHTLRTELAKLRNELLLRDALLTGGWDAISVLSTDRAAPLNFGRGIELLRSCQSGPDSDQVSHAVEGLAHDGKAFDMFVRGTEGRVQLRGRPVGSRAVVFARLDKSAADLTQQLLALLNALATPVWVRDRALKLIWANQAYVAAGGERSIDAVLARNGMDSFPEQALSARVRQDGVGVDSQCTVAAAGRNKTFAVRLRPTAGDTIAGVAWDTTEAADVESRLRTQSGALFEVLDGLSVAVAVFGRDRRLLISNRALSERFAISPDELERHPLLDEFLDHLRATARCPEQREFAGWKRGLIELFSQSDVSAEQIWHMPNGRSERMSVRPHPLGGLVFFFEDITDHVETRRSFNQLVKVQKATLDTIDEAIAVFGLDGKLKLHNAAFAQIWALSDTELADEPHINRLSQLCTERFGADESWAIVASGVNAPGAEECNTGAAVARADGRVVTLTLTRLPDGATIVRFSDVTDYVRFENMLKYGERVA
jgi:PAS domain-containing protein